MPLQIIRQDITRMKVDAIVNTTNEEMVGYSGVDLAVHTLAGPGLDDECERLAPLELGCAKITGGHRLPCKYVIHTSGPIWFGGHSGESDILRSCYIESLKLAVRHGCRTVAFPLISAGVYQFPKDQVLKFAIQTITEFLFEHELNVYICVFDKESYSFSQKLFDDIKTFIDDDYVDTHGEDFFIDYDCYYDGDDVYDYYDCYYHDVSPQDESNEPAIVLTTENTPCSSIAGRTLDEYVTQIDRSFREMLFDLIDKSGMTDVECYKRANVDKRTFSKIKGRKEYRPSKQTAVAFAIALKLDLDTTQELLATVGLTLSRSNVADKIVRYFIYNKNYDIFEINEALFEFKQKLLGSI